MSYIYVPKKYIYITSYHITRKSISLYSINLCSWEISYYFPQNRFLAPQEGFVSGVPSGPMSFSSCYGTIVNYSGCISTSGGCCDSYSGWWFQRL